MRSSVHAWFVWPLLVALAWPSPLQASTPPLPSLRAAEVPLAVPTSVTTAVTTTGTTTGTSEPGPEDMSERPATSGEPTVEGPAAPPISAIPTTTRVPAPTAAIVDEGPQQITVAVGLGPSAPGSKPERAVVDALERSVRATKAPGAQVRRLRAGAGEGRAVCREHRDDLVILLEYLPDRDDPVLVTRDCRLDRELGIRGQAAAQEPELVAALWAEHLQLVRDGARERKVRISRKLKTGLIAGGAIVAVGLAIALVLVSSLRRDTVVIKVGP